MANTSVMKLAQDNAIFGVHNAESVGQGADICGFGTTSVIIRRSYNESRIAITKEKDNCKILWICKRPTTRLLSLHVEPWYRQVLFETSSSMSTPSLLLRAWYFNSNARGCVINISKYVISALSHSNMTEYYTVENSFFVFQ